MNKLFFPEPVSDPLSNLSDKHEPARVHHRCCEAPMRILNHDVRQQLVEIVAAHLMAGNVCPQDLTAAGPGGEVQGAGSA